MILMTRKTRNYRQTKHTFHINNKKGNIPKQILAEAKKLPLLGDTQYL